MEKLCKRIENECFNKTQETKSCTTEKRIKYKKSDIRECFIDYSLEDKVAALRCMIDYNEKHAEDAPVHSRAPKTTIGVKECMQADQETQFQTIISELKNTVTNSYWNKEVGKIPYQTPNLPTGMNPWETVFGKKIKSETTMNDLLQANTNQMDILKPDILDMYKKSHNSYLPAEQIRRNYKEPFNQAFCFGKFNNADVGGTKVKKRLTWINPNPFTLVNSILADFKERTHSRVGEVRNSKQADIFMDMVHGKVIKRSKTNILSDNSINNDVEEKKYLQYINGLRQKYKKQFPEIPFLDIQEELANLDKDYTGLLPEETVFSILAKYKMYVNKLQLIPLLDLLSIHKEQNVNYTELLNLLNWKYVFPTLPRVKTIPLECQCYHTAYRDMIENIKETDTTKETLCKTLKDNRITAYDLIFPSVFTRHGLDHDDLTKPRDKEEIRSIFTNIGIQFTDDSFNLLWKEGLKKYNVQTLSVLTFKSLSDQYNMTIDKKDL